MEENTNTFSFFDYELNGRKLTINEMIDIHNKYEIACTAEYLFENYDLNTEQQAICLSEEVHRYMDKNDATESDAINSVLKGDYKWR